MFVCVVCGVSPPQPATRVVVEIGAAAAARRAFSSSSVAGVASCELFVSKSSICLNCG